MKVRKKPVVVEAWEFDGDLQGPWQGHVEARTPSRESAHGPVATGKTKFFIKTLEGDMEVKVGEYIIKGVNGEFYPCKPDIFRKTYDEVDGDIPRVPVDQARAELLGGFIGSLLVVRETVRAVETCESCMGVTVPVSDAIEASDTYQRKLKGVL